MKPKEPINAACCAAIQELRARLKMGVSKFARLVGSNPTSIRYCERGERGLRRSVILRACEAAASYRMPDIVAVLETDAAEQ